MLAQYEQFKKFNFLDIFKTKTALCVYGDYAKQRNIYLKCEYSVNNNTKLKNLDSFYLNYLGWIKTKNHLTLLSLQGHQLQGILMFNFLILF